MNTIERAKMRIKDYDTRAKVMRNGAQEFLRAGDTSRHRACNRRAKVLEDLRQDWQDILERAEK